MGRVGAGTTDFADCIRGRDELRVVVVDQGFALAVEVADLSSLDVSKDGLRIGLCGTIQIRGSPLTSPASTFSTPSRP